MSHCPCPTGDPGPCQHCGSSDWTITTKHFPSPLVVFKGIAEGDWIVRYDAYHAHCEYEANEQGKFRRTGGGRIIPQDKHTVRNRVAKADERKAKDAKQRRLEAREP